MFNAVKIASFTALTCFCGPAFAQDLELSFYSGWQTAPHSEVSGTRPDGTDFNETFGWEGKSLSAPPYYGARVTWWRSEKLGFGLELTHAKVYGNQDDMTDAGFERFEMTDGLNIVTLNTMHRWTDTAMPVQPYLGAGLGLAIPHVDVVAAGGGKTFGYQVTGPAARVIAGASYQLGESWSVFGEYQGTYSSHEATLEPEGDFETGIITNAVNLGVSFGF